MSKKEMLEEICQYKLFLLQLLNTFESNQKEIKDKETRKYFKQLCVAIEEQAHEFMNKIDSIRNEKNMIIENQMKEIEFYKNIIKGILHF